MQGRSLPSTPPQAQNGCVCVSLCAPQGTPRLRVAGLSSCSSQWSGPKRIAIQPGPSAGQPVGTTKVTAGQFRGAQVWRWRTAEDSVRPGNVRSLENWRRPCQGLMLSRGNFRLHPFTTARITFSGASDSPFSRLGSERNPKGAAREIRICETRRTGRDEKRKLNWPLQSGKRAWGGHCRCNGMSQ